MKRLVRTLSETKLITFITLLLLLGLWVGLHHYEHAQQKFRLEVKTAIIETEIDELLECTTIAASRKLATHPLVIKACSNGQVENDAPITRFLEGSKIGGTSNIVYVLDRTGTVTTCSPYGDKKTLVGNSYAFRPYFKRAIEGTANIYCALGVTTGRRGMYFAVPVFKESEKEPIGVLVIKQGMARLDTYLRHHPFSCALVSPEDVILSSNRKNAILKTTRPLSTEEKAKLTKSRQFADKELKPLHINDETLLQQGKDAGSTVIVKRKFHHGNWYLLAWTSYHYPYPTAVLASTLLVLLAISWTSGLKAIIRRQERDALKQEAIVHAHKQAREWQLTFDSISDMICLHNKDGAILTANQAFADFVQKQRHEIAGEHCTTLIPDLAETNDNQLFEIATNNHSSTATLQYLRNWNTYLDTTIAPVINDDEEIIRYVRVMKDITKRKRNEEEVQKAHQEIRNILDYSPFGVIIIGANQKIKWVNTAAWKMLNVEGPEVLVGGNCQEYLCPNGENRCMMLSESTPQHSSEETIKRADGAELPVFRTINRMEFEEEEVLLETFIDISELKKVETELRQAQKLESVGQLAAGIAHEINTPVQFVGDNVRFLQDSLNDLLNLQNQEGLLLNNLSQQSPPPEHLEEINNTIEEIDLEFLAEEMPQATTQALEGVERIASIVRAMKEFAHPSSAEMAFADLNKAIETTVTVTRNEWKYVSELETDLDPELPPVPCLVNEFNQVILNMIINARDAIEEKMGENSTEEKGKITISTRRNRDMVEIRLSDTGQGIPEDCLRRIFDPFFTTKQVGKGSGQGLAISRNVITEKHQGKLDVESTPGQGTTFIIQLPFKSVK